MDSISTQQERIISDSRWPQPLKIDQVRPLGQDYVRVTGSLLNTGEHVDTMLSRAEFEAMLQQTISTGFDAPPGDVFLSLETKRYRYASLYDPLLAMSISKVDPLPHQIEAVYNHILRQPRVRFLIADDPGAGKTIMAGLVIKEMKLRGLIKRILIVTPGHLKDQWRREMKERFEERFILVDRATIHNRFGENVWETEFQVITSLDFARQDDVMNALTTVHWDLVIVDEAHKMAAHRYGKKINKTKRYRLGEILSRNSTQLLFLTATPHRGDRENFRLFLDLLQPGAFATTEMLEKSIRSGDNPLFIRRLKEDLKDFEGRPLFLPRHIKTMTFDLGMESPAERKLYNALSHYVKEQYNKALSHDKHRNIAFALVILQRRLASSTYALRSSLKRRKKRLEEMLAKADAFNSKRMVTDVQKFSFDDVEEMSEAERWKLESLWETLSVAENRAELKAEIRTLETLLGQAEKIITQGEEIKLRRFRDALNELLTREPGEKVLIFTESRDTLIYLTRRMQDWGYTTCTIHGGMPLEERIEAEKIFKNEAQVLVATEAAGEGINLQFCHLMINYDIPWNPNRLEQRMGRIHRYGQTHEVTIFNLVASDTREGIVLNRLFEKLDEIREALGSDKVFDVIDELFPGRNFPKLLAEAATKARTFKEILSEIEISVDEEYLRTMRDRLGDSLATRYINYAAIRDMSSRAREQRLIPEYTQAFFRQAWDRLKGNIRPRRDAGREAFFIIEKIPHVIHQIAQRDEFRRRFGPLLPRYSLVTFDKNLALREARAEFISFGHPLFEAVLQWIEETLTPALQQGATFWDPDGRYNGTFLFFEGQISDGLGNTAGKRLFALFVPQEGGDVILVNPAVIWDLLPAEQAAETSVDMDALRSQGIVELIPHLERYRDELLAERQRQAHIKRKYGLESLRYLITELDNDLIHLQERALAEEDVALALHNKRQQKSSYLQAMKELQEQLEREVQLTLNTPRFVSALLVLPLPNSPEMTDDAMHSSDEIEQVGMAMTMRYERQHQRTPQDVSLENLGYDVLSTDPQSETRRYIEVKARAGIGPVSLTRNEWFTAQRLGDDFYLYVVFNAATKPQLYVLRNPAQHLKPEERTEVRYLVPPQSITEHGSPEATRNTNAQERS